MNYSILFSRCLLCIAITVLFANCQSETSPTYQNEAVENALQKADSIPIAGLEALAQSLPGTTEQDSFFAMYLSNLSAKKGLDSLAAALPIFEKLRGKQIFTQSFIAEHRGLIHQLSGRFDSAEHYYTRSISLWENTPELAKYAEALHTRATLFNAKGNLESAIIDRYKAVEVLQNALDKPNLTAAEKENLESTLLEVRTFFANDFIKKKEYQKALDVLEAPTAYYLEKNDVRMAALCLTTAARAYESLNDLPKAFEYSQKSMDLLRPAGIQSQLGISLNNYAKLLQLEGKWQQALDTLQVAKVIFEKLNNQVALSRINFNMGRSQARLGQLKEAESNLQFAYTLNDQRKDYPLLLDACNELVRLHKQKGEFAAALNFQEKANAVSDSIMNREKEEITKNLEVKHQTREKEQELKNLKRETQLERQRNWWLGGSASLIFGLVFYFSTMQNRRRQQLLENEKTIMQREKQFVEALAQLKSKELEQSKNELQKNQIELSQAIQLLETKNQFIKELNMRVHHHTQAAPSERDTSVPHAAKQVSELRQMKILTPEDWQQFQQRFEQQFPYFLENMRQQLPAITAAETRLFLLIKLQFTNQEISETLGISIESVWKSRYRLARKLDLVPGTLEPFVEGFQ